nr:metallophosphoesterase [Paracoccus marinaquae]
MSDLHFGLHRGDLVGALLDRINHARADLVVVTGDLTHRGRPGQFRQAAGFLARINAPVMAVPGNHDVPLYNIPLRFAWPFAGFSEAIGADLAPTRAAGTVRVLGLNSTDPFSWQRGVIRRGEIDRLIGGIDPLATNILALHHPLQQLPAIDKELATRAPEALRRLGAAGLHVVLSGHLHLWDCGGLLACGHPGVLQIQAGTALCSRLGDRQNEFAVLDFAGTGLTVERHVAPMAQEGFQPPERLHFRRGGGVWQALDQGPPVPMLPGATDTAFRTA